jgi:hypothetical protein
MKLSQSKFGIIKAPMLTGDRNWGMNYTNLNNLYQAGLIKTDTEALGGMGQLASMKSLFDGTAPLLELAQGADTITVDGNKVEWEFMVSGYRPSLIVEDVAPSNTTKGIAQRPFPIKLDLGTYVEGDTLVFTDSKKYNMRVMAAGQKDGSATIYTVKLMTDDPTLFVPTDLFVIGSRVMKLASTYSEGSVKGGSMSVDSIGKIKFRSGLSRFRKQYQMTGDAAQRKLNGNLTEADLLILAGRKAGESTDAFQKRIATAMNSKNKGNMYITSVAEIKFNKEFEMEKELHLMYQRSSSTVVDESTGYYVNQGPGLQEILEDGYREFYNTFTIGLVKDFLQDIFFGRVAYDQRNVVMWTGEIGLRLFDEAINQITQGFFKDMKDYFIKTDGASLVPGGPTGLSYTETPYTQYKLKFGGSLTVMHMKAYDDVTFNTILDENGYPAESSRFTFINYGLGDGFGKNIAYLKSSRDVAYGYTGGLSNPYGNSQGALMSHAGDFWTVHRMEDAGILVKDVTKCGELIPAALRGK